MNNGFKLCDIPDIFKSGSKELLGELASQASETTKQYFGRTIGLYAPIYISNYCDNYCVYCGFNSKNNITRKKLSFEEIEKECLTLKKIGIQNILILTGESRNQSPVSFIKGSVLIAKKYFPNISLEIYPLETEEYKELFLAGVDGIALYQETYNRHRYEELHLEGKKKDYDYRLNAVERIAKSGIRRISMGVLLGLSDWKEDVYALFSHLDDLWRKFPGIEYSLSFPRLLKITNDANLYAKVDDFDMLKIVSAARILFPRVGINLSTRESAYFRDKILSFGITSISAGSSTVVGGYNSIKKNDGQFETNDKRPLKDIKAMLIENGFDPVITDWRRIPNE